MGRLVRFGAVVLMMLGLCLGPAAAAPSLDAAKAAGLVGERIDGYVGVVGSGAPADIRAMVEQVNAERHAKYTAIAAKQKAPVEAVGQIAGKKLIERAPKGEYVQGADGQWRQK